MPLDVDRAVLVLLRAGGRDGLKPRPKVMIDKQFLETPFFGVQQMNWDRQNESYGVNHKRTRRGMFLMVKGDRGPSGAA